MEPNVFPEIVYFKSFFVHLTELSFLPLYIDLDYSFLQTDFVLLICYN